MLVSLQNQILYHCTSNVFSSCDDLSPAGVKFIHMITIIRFIEYKRNLITQLRDKLFLQIIKAMINHILMLVKAFNSKEITNDRTTSRTAEKYVYVQS